MLSVPDDEAVGASLDHDHGLEARRGDRRLRVLERDADRRAVPGGERGVELGEERALADREALFVRFDDRPKLDQDDFRIAGLARIAPVQRGDIGLQPGVVDVDGQLDVLTGLRAEGAGDGIGDEGVRTELPGRDEPDAAVGREHEVLGERVLRRGGRLVGGVAADRDSRDRDAVGDHALAVPLRVSPQWVPCAGDRDRGDEPDEHEDERRAGSQPGTAGAVFPVAHVFGHITKTASERRGSGPRAGAFRFPPRRRRER